MTIAALVDANSVLYRMHYGVPPMNRKSDGMPTNALFGLARALIEARKGVDLFLCAWDPPGPTFRHALMPEYKEERKAPDEITAQRSWAHRLANAFGHSVVLPGFEADDVLASVAKQLKGQARVDIVTVDKDLMACIDASNPTQIWHPVKRRHLGVQDVRGKFGVDPWQVPHVQALCGDSTDGYPGLPGIGIKTAGDLIREHGDLTSLFNNTHLVKQKKRRETLEAGRADALRYFDIARLDDSCYTANMDALARPIDRSAVLELFRQLEFNSLMEKV